MEEEKWRRESGIKYLERVSFSWVIGEKRDNKRVQFFLIFSKKHIIYPIPLNCKAKNNDVSLPRIFSAYIINFY